MASTFITASTDTGYYTGSLYNLTYPKENRYDSVTSSRYFAFQYEMFVFKSALKTAGWTVVAWGSGSQTGTYSDPFTSYSRTGSIGLTGSMTTNLSWFVIKMPGSSRSLCFQKSGTGNEASLADWFNQDYRVKYSPTGFAVTSSLSGTMTPGPITASHELVVCGAGTDASPTFAAFFPTYVSGIPRAYFYMIVQKVAPYGFMLLNYQLCRPTGLFMLDPVVNAHSLDQDPYVLWQQNDIGTNTFNILAQHDTVNTMMLKDGKWCFSMLNLPGMISGSIIQGSRMFEITDGVRGYGQGTSLGIFPARNRFTAMREAFPMMYIISGSTSVVAPITGSFKGFSSFVKLPVDTLGPGAFPTGDRAFTPVSFYAHFDAIRMNGAYIPWVGVERIENE